MQVGRELVYHDEGQCAPAQDMPPPPQQDHLTLSDLANLATVVQFFK